MEILDILSPIAGLCLLLGFSAFFSGSETALCALSRTQVERLRHEGTKHSRAIVRLVDDPRRLFITILLGNTFVNIAFATITAVLIYRLLGRGPSGLTTTAIVLFITVLLLMFGEITPKTIAIRHAERFSRTVARPLWIFSAAITPLRKILRLLTDVLIPLFSGTASAESLPITGDDIRALLEAQGEASVAPDERDMLGRILELRNIEAHEVMIAHADMISTTTRATIDDTLELARRVGLSRIPVFRDEGDEVCGIFHVKDWLLWRKAGVRELRIDEFLSTRSSIALEGDADTLVRAPHFAAQTTKLADLFSELTREKTKIVLLSDDAGRVSGVVSVEDIVEELVGEIVDEHDVRGAIPDLHRRADDPAIIDVAGRVGIRQLNRDVGLNLDDELARTVGDYVLGLFGRFPSVGESFTDENGVRFEVRAAIGDRIAMVTLTLPDGYGRADA